MFNPPPAHGIPDTPAVSAQDGGTQRASAAREFVAIVDHILMGRTKLPHRLLEYAD